MHTTEAGTTTHVLWHTRTRAEDGGLFASQPWTCRIAALLQSWHTTEHALAAFGQCCWSQCHTNTHCTTKPASQPFLFVVSFVWHLACRHKETKNKQLGHGVVGMWSGAVFPYRHRFVSGEVRNSSAASNTTRRQKIWCKQLSMCGACCLPSDVAVAPVALWRVPKAG